MSNVEIPLEEYTRLVIDNQRLWNEMTYLKERIDRTNSLISSDISEIKEILKGCDKSE